MNSGFNFSPFYCDQIGVDWREVLDFIISLRPHVVRVSAYWAFIEPETNFYDFSQMDEIVNKLIKHGVEIVMTVGIKGQRWPEYFPPSWAVADIASPGELQRQLGQRGEPNPLQASLLKFMRETVSRYADQVAYWQIENEPFNYAFPFNIALHKSLVLAEVDEVRRLTDSQLIINGFHSDNFGAKYVLKLTDWWTGYHQALNKVDIQGLNVYSTLNVNLLGKNLILHNDTHLVESGAKAVTELQAEPWPSTNPMRDFRNLVWQAVRRGDWGKASELAAQTGLLATSSGRPRNASFDPHVIIRSYAKLANSNLRFYLWWGVEYWFYCKEVTGDSSWVNAYLELTSSDPRN